MTMQTELFYDRKKRGGITRLGKVSFIDGRRICYRRMWLDLFTGEKYVIYKGEAEKVELYSLECQEKQRERFGDEGFLIGRLV